MARRLTKQQQRKVEQIQQQRLQRARRGGAAADIETGELGEEREGLVVARYGATLDVEDDQGTCHRCQLRQNIEEMVCGDRVIWQAAPDGSGVVVALAPRRNVLCRPDFKGRIKLVASNIDQIMVVCAVVPELSTGLIDRYLVAAEATGILPLIVINKTDLLAPSAREELDGRLAPYRRLGYPVIHTSARALHGLDELVAALRGHTSILVGHSGVGKSSLVQALLPDAQIRVGELSEASGKGMHTTTTAVLYHLPQGGDLIDSPGIREFGLWEITPEQAAAGFIEFRPFLGQCRFRDCSHHHEPGCAIRAAAENGAISRERLESYYRIAASLTPER